MNAGTLSSVSSRRAHLPYRRAWGQDEQPVQRSPDHQHRGDQQRHGVVGTSPEDHDGDRGADRDEGGVEGDVVEGVSAWGESHLSEGGPHPRCRVRKLGVVKGNAGYEPPERDDGHRHPRHAGKREPPRAWGGG
jgi:hypothetical protein